MRRRTATLLEGALFWLALTGVALAQEDASAAKPAAAGTKVTGVFEIDITLSVSPDLPNGTTINVSPGASAIDAKYNNAADAFASTKVAGGKASIVVRIPYTWRVASTNDTVTISFSAFANASNATFPSTTIASSRKASNFRRTARR